MSEIRAQYAPDGEWLKISTAPSGASVDTIKPADDDLGPLEPVASTSEDERVTGLDAGKPWKYVASEQGTFLLTLPEDRPLEDWSLALYGLPRMYNHLNTDVVTELLGQQAGQLLEEIRSNTRLNWQSFDELRRKAASRGRLSSQELDDEFDHYPHATMPMTADLNESTRLARQRLLDQATKRAGNLIVPRSVLIRSWD